ncbi:MAG TPA: RtcB family protein, partial [Dermatophilaceae bacterium]|nr:RtcB family protein [Dermatophilaceae bacterium]
MTLPTHDYTPTLETSRPGFPTRLPGSDADVLMWADPAEVEPAALAQLRNIGALPWVVGVRVMPDVHLGKGATVGSVIAMSQAVAPAAVGVDIGCGMAAVRTSLSLDDLPDDLHPLRTAIERAVPVGFAGHQVPVDPTALGMPRADLPAEGWARFWKGFDSLDARVADQAKKAHSQLGTLGGGNHFIEVCSDDDGAIWVMLH